VGYETQRIFIDHSTKQISILLNPVMQTLPDVEIRAKNDPLPFFKDRKYSVLDYEVVDRQVYLLVYLSILKSPQLLCKTFDGDTVARSQPLPIKPKGLFRDCLGNIHVLDNDSAYQVCKHGDILTLCYSSGLDRFNAFLADCVTATDSVLYFRKESPDQLSVEFYQVNRFNNRRLLLAALGDEEKQRMMRLNPGDYELLTMKTPPRNIEQAVAWQWLKKVVYLNNSSSLNRVDDLLCIINTTEHTLELYTLGGAFTSRLKIPIEEGGATHWTKDMFVDPVRHKLYTSFLKSGGNFFLYNIDLNTGALRQTIRAEHAFPQKVRIQGNYLFYMYDIPGEGDNRHLFRQKF
jgi:hypothetical protein